MLFATDCHFNWFTAGCFDIQHGYERKRRMVTLTRIFFGIVHTDCHIAVRYTVIAAFANWD
ncbi:hypothetical protein D3C85_1669430 [compost metagenome]